MVGDFSYAFVIPSTFYIMLVLCFLRENEDLVQQWQIFWQINPLYRSDLYGPCSKVSCQTGSERRLAPWVLFPFHTWETEPIEVQNRPQIDPK